MEKTAYFFQVGIKKRVFLETIGGMRMNTGSCIQTIELLRRLALNVHGVIDAVDDRNCNEIISLLKEQRARVMALDELTEIYVEFKGDNCPIRLTNFDLQKIVKYAVDGDCRLWTGKPTDEQRQAVKWDD